MTLVQISVIAAKRLRSGDQSLRKDTTTQLRRESFLVHERSVASPSPLTPKMNFTFASYVSAQISAFIFDSATLHISDCLCPKGFVLRLKKIIMKTEINQISIMALLTYQCDVYMDPIPPLRLRLALM